MMVLAIVSIFLSFVCLLYTVHMSIVYSTFNRNVKDWSASLDDAVNESINRTARNILRELDRKISEINDKKDLSDEETRREEGD